MTVVGWDALAERPLEGDIVLTIGVFDGLHRGHRRLIERLIGHGGGAPAVLSFSPLPSSVLFGTSDRLISSQRQKERDLHRLGIEFLIVVDFSVSFSQITGEAFVSQMFRRATVRGVVVGRDFRCGRDRDTDTRKLHRLLQRRGVDIDIVDLVRCQTARVHSEVVAQGDAETKVSSSAIRQAIEDGDFATVRSLLGGDYELDVEHVTPERAGDRLAFPAASLTQLLPRPGRYSGYAAGIAGRSAARITVEPDRVMVSGALDDSIGDDTIGIRFERQDA